MNAVTMYVKGNHEPRASHNGTVFSPFSSIRRAAVTGVECPRIHAVRELSLYHGCTIGIERTRRRVYARRRAHGFTPLPGSQAQEVVTPGGRNLTQVLPPGQGWACPGNAVGTSQAKACR